MEREQAKVVRSVLVLSTEVATARRERDQGKQSELDQWRDEARRAREAAKEKTKDREPTRDRGNRDGPDYER